ncbi:MAG TPA: ATP-binding protein [Bryobacteraceae bacterium]|jgi:signal transduction histidine kinase|nr:ATP-binding protein [Bryobacteraceae bacterium]
MRSLFAKILLWFVVAVVTVLAATVLTTALTYDTYSSRQAPFPMLLTFAEKEAQKAWETGGREQLRETLERLREVTHASQTMLLDADGIDLLTGEARGELRPYAEKLFHSPFSIRSRIFAHRSADSKYFLIVVRETWFFWFLQPAHLLVIVVAVLLCYWLAHYLTAPLRRLRAAVDSLGRGDLTARAEETRKDELGDLAAAFNRMADHIQTLLAAERRLLFDISHELRSPLARLSVAVELARTDETNAPPLDRIQKEADRLNSLIRQMLEVTRTEGEPSRLKAEPLRLDELVDRLVDDCSIEALAHGCALDLASSGPVTLSGDSELLRRAIENVMRNAIRYAPKESTVEVSLENGGGWAKIRIRDYGPGVPDEALPRLFDPFYRVEQDRDRKSGGVGLGLSIARRAVELHKGKLRASNAVPGLLVEIELPA